MGLPADKTDRGEGRHNLRRTSERAREWEELRRRLTGTLRCLEAGQFLILEARGGASVYVQFAAGGDEGMRAEAVSNRYLEHWEALDATAEARLRRLGWRPPTEVGDGPVNWWRDFDAPVPSERVAALAVDTLAKAFDVPRPARLTYKAFTRAGQEILLPELGVDHRPSQPPAPPLAERVDAALRRYLDADEIVYDADGDAPIRADATMVFVRTLAEPRLVSVFAPVLIHVEPGAALYRAVNDINAECRFGRALITGSGVIVGAEVDDAPGLEDALARACDAVAWIANHWGPILKARFGGLTFFEKPAGGPAPGSAAASGGYL